MQMHPRLFHRHRRHDPLRRAEARTFDALKRCGRPGFTHYEWQRNRRSPQLDFALWPEEVGRFGLQVKGGRYRLEQGEWQFWDFNSGEYRGVPTCPLAVTSDAAMSLLKELAQALDRSNFVVPVLVFPDRDPDPATARRAERSNVHLVWRRETLPETLPDRLTRIAREARVFHPPNEAAVRREVAVITDGQVSYPEESPARGLKETPKPAPDRVISALPTKPSVNLPGVEISERTRLVVLE